MLHFRPSFLNFIEILHQLLHGVEEVAFCAVLPNFICVVVHTNLSIKNVGMSLIVALVLLIPR
jgi:hypothetical protein